MTTPQTIVNDLRGRKLNWPLHADDVLAILDSTYLVPYGRCDVRRLLQKRDSHAYVSVAGRGRVVGVYAWREDGDVLEIIEFAVSPDWYGCGIGRWQMDQLKSRLGEIHFTLRHDVHERDDEAIGFLANMGFRATLIRGIASDGGDCYRMEYRDS